MPQIFDAMAKHFHITKEQHREILQAAVRAFLKTESLGQNNIYFGAD